MPFEADVIILCAGLGTRLRPLTDELPKPAVPLLNRPLVASALTLVRESGASRVIINTHWLPEAMAETAQSECSRLGLDLLVSHEHQILGSGGGLWQARERGLTRRDRPLIVLNGDVLTDIDLRSVLQAHVDSGADATMVLRPMPDGGGYTPVEAEVEGIIRRIGKHGRTIGARAMLFTGAQVLSPAALNLLPAGESSVVERVLAPLVEEGRVRAFVERGLWLDLGDAKGYLDAHLAILQGQIDRRTLDRFGFTNPLSAVAADAEVASSARLEETVVGPGASIGEGAGLIQCVVWPGAAVDADVQLERCIVTRHSVVHAAE